MIRWLQKQSIGVRLCFVFVWCSGFYALLFVLNDTGVTAVSLVILTVFPLFYGAFTQLILAPRLERGAGRVFALGLIPVMVLCAGLLIAEFETLICIAILCPAFIALMAAGQLLFAVFLRKAMADAYQETLNVSLLLLPVLFVPVFGQISFPEGHMLVQTEIRIAAPAHVVWDHTYEINEIKDSERVWTFSHNILRTPVPLDAKVRGKVRDLRWSGDIRFEEHLTKIVPARHLAWDFVFDSRRPLHALDPHLAPQGGIVHMRSGSYSLTPLPEGETLLILETHYSVATPVNLYLSLWGEVFLQDFHFAVLSVIKARSEGSI